MDPVMPFDLKWASVTWSLKILMKNIPLYGRRALGRSVIVDDDDFEHLNRWHWRVSQNGYVFRNAGVWSHGKVKWRKVVMHRELISAGPGELVDHKNRNRFDNRRSNLRKCSRFQNQWNIALSARNKTGFVGVRVKNGRWRANIRNKGKQIGLGTFGTAVEAARAYNHAAKRLRGEFAWINPIPKER